MDKITLVARLLLGVIFFVFGLNGFFHFLPMPPLADDAAGNFTRGLLASGYFFPLLKGTEVLCGLALLIGAFVPLALIVLAPILIHIFMFHACLAPSGLPMAIILGVLEIYLAFFSMPYSPIVKQIFRCPMKESMDAKKKR